MRQPFGLRSCSWKNMAEWSIEQLDATHERGAFCCGKAPLDTFLQQRASQHAKNGLSRTFVATRPGEKRVLGYYASSAGSFTLDHLPEKDRKRLPRHPVPTVHLGRLAVDQSVRGQGLGRILLFHFLKKAQEISRTVGVYAVDLWSKDEEARSFYIKYGFLELQDDRLHLYLPLATVAQMFAQVGAEE
jgi:GNAT superfamily N-acetyltransferase